MLGLTKLPDFLRSEILFTFTLLCDGTYPQKNRFFGPVDLKILLYVD